jgi:hypothetical protein
MFCFSSPVLQQAPVAIWMARPHSMICLLNSTPRFGAQFFLHGLAALAFLAFAAELSARMQNAQKGADSLPFLMLGGGLLWSALWLGGIGLAAAASDPGDYQVNAEGARSIFVLTNALLLAEASGLLYLPLALFLWATAMAAKEALTGLNIWKTWR